MPGKNITLFPLLIALLLLSLSACSNSIPRDRDVEISMKALSPDALRGLEMIHIGTDRQVEIYTQGRLSSGTIPEWQYRRLLSKLRRMNIVYWAKDKFGLLEESETAFTLEVRVPSPPMLLKWNGNKSEVFNPVLSEFQSIRREIVKIGEDRKREEIRFAYNCRKSGANEENCY